MRRLDRKQGNQHHFARLHTLTRGVASTPQHETTTIAEADEVHARRQAVERAMELYVTVTGERLRIKLNAALLAEAKEMGFCSPADLHDWQLTVGNKLTLLRRMCGQCRPLFGQHESVCIHADDLITAARLQNEKRTCKRLADVCDRQLGSQTTRRRMRPADVKRIEATRNAARQHAAKVSKERRSIIHKLSYAEACELFWLACSQRGPQVRAYCFREDA